MMPSQACGPGLRRATRKHSPSCITSMSIDPKYKYPGNEISENVAAYHKGAATLASAVDDQVSKMWLLQ